MLADCPLMLQEVKTVRIMDKQHVTHVGPVSHVVLLPVSRLVIVACDDGQIRICL